MIQLGISAFYHDSAACIVKDGKVLYAIEQEKLSGIKHDDSFPVDAIKWVLRASKLTIKDIDEVCWYEIPELKRARVLKSFNKYPLRTFFKRLKFLRERKELHNPSFLLAKHFLYQGTVRYVEHHLSHAAFSYFTSPYKEAAVVTIDGVGEFETVTISKAKDNTIEKVFSINFPESLGLYYSTFTAFLGFKPNEGEYKVMGMAGYGDANKYVPFINKLFRFNKETIFSFYPEYFAWEYSDKIMFTSELCNVLGRGPRLPEDEITQDDYDLAAAVQFVYEKQFNRILEKAKELVDSDNLCLGGGCAYNGLANTKAYKHYASIHVPFAPSDAGSAIGACLASYKGPRKDNSVPYIGPSFNEISIRTQLEYFGNKIYYFRYPTEERLLNKVASIIHSGNIVGWFQGNMEFGARALGNRSILASPLQPGIKDKINKVIKKRESFRPFAPTCIEEDANMFFDVKEPVPYMNQVVEVKKSHRLPSITHVDNTARVQTVTKKQNSRYYELLLALKRISGYPICLNTSFNFKDQTITITPKQAVERFLDSKMDFLVIDNYLIIKMKHR
jgi:carbamoyltransferase